MTAVDETPGDVLLRESQPPPRDGTRPGPPAPIPRGDDRSRRRKPFTPVMSWSLAGAVPAVLVIAVAVEPAANGPEPTSPVWLNIIATVTLMAAMFAVAALVTVQWSGVWLTLFTGAGWLLLAALCPISGHHLAGSHTYVQFVLFGGLTMASLVVLRRCHRPHGAAEHSRLVV